MRDWVIWVVVVLLFVVVTATLIGSVIVDDPCVGLGFEGSVVVDDETYCYYATCGEECVAGMVAVSEVE